MKIKVTNIPVRGFVSADVDVPELPAESDELQQAIAAALANAKIPDHAESVEVDAALIRGGWEFSIG